MEGPYKSGFKACSDEKISDESSISSDIKYLDEIYDFYTRVITRGTYRSSHDLPTCDLRRGDFSSTSDIALPGKVFCPSGNESTGEVEHTNHIFGNRAGFRDWTNEQMQRAHKAAKKQARPLWLQRAIQYSIYTGLVCTVYFALVGWPIWHGAIYSYWFAYQHNLILTAGTSIFIGVAMVYTVLPLTIQFDASSPVDVLYLARNREKAMEVAVIIPCYKSASIIGPTLDAALKIFPPQNIFVVSNGNSELPLDNTEEVCYRYGVRHIWVGIGSKIVAQFVGCQAAYEYKYALLIDDDVSLPYNFPIVSEKIQLGRSRGLVKCVGHTIRSTGPDGSEGSLCQQAQDVEYKLAGLMREFGGHWGSATSPHGAIALWEQDFLEECFRRHPGFTISEDWFFGHVCRSLGGRIQMCSAVFVGTETPANLVRNKLGARAGYGEMTVTKQRMSRWNFFLVSRTWYNVLYILFSWKLGWFEFATKLWVFQEIYESCLLLTSPLFIPVASGSRPAFAIPISVGVLLLYYVAVTIFNEVHLRRRQQRINPKTYIILWYWDCTRTLQASKKTFGPSPTVLKLYFNLVNVWSCLVNNLLGEPLSFVTY